MLKALLILKKAQLHHDLQYDMKCKKDESFTEKTHFSRLF